MDVVFYKKLSVLCITVAIVRSLTENCGLTIGGYLLVSGCPQDCTTATYYTVGKYLWHDLSVTEVNSCNSTGSNCKYNVQTYPLVKTFNSDVFPQAPSPLSYASQHSPIANNPTTSPLLSDGLFSQGYKRTAVLACAARTLFHHRAASRRVGLSAIDVSGRFEEERAGAKVIPDVGLSRAREGIEDVRYSRTG